MDQEVNETPSKGRPIRVAAVADLHMDGTHRGRYTETFRTMDREADILAICGDLTAHGRPEELQALLEDLAPVEVPVLAVLGNHDYEADQDETLAAMLQDAGVHLLDGDSVIIDGVGFVGTKGFAGGFGRGSLGAFGETIIKQFVQAAIDEALKLENGLRELETEEKVVLLHYSPIAETLEGEPEVIYPFLGSSRLAQPLDTLGASVVFHGHAHYGRREGRTASGIPVYNVAVSVLENEDVPFHIWTTTAPDRRGAPAPTRSSEGAHAETPR